MNAIVSKLSELDLGFILIIAICFVGAVLLKIVGIFGKLADARYERFKAVAEREYSLNHRIREGANEAIRKMERGENEPGDGR